MSNRAHWRAFEEYEVSMVAIFGDITGQDDYTHALGPESNFNESM